MAENKISDSAKQTNEEINRLTSLLQQKDEEIENFKQIIAKLQDTVDNLAKQIENLSQNIQNSRQPDNSNTRRTQLNTVNNSNQKNKSSKRRISGDNLTNTSTQDAIKINANKKTKKVNELNEKENTSTKSDSIDVGNNSISVEHKPMETDQNDNSQTNLDESSQNNTGKDCQNEFHNTITNDDNNEWQFMSYKNKTENNSKIQPIQVTIADEGFGALYNNLQNSVGNNNFTINQLKSKTSVRVYPASNNIAGKIIESLSDHGYEFHSYLNKESKKKCFLIKGLNGFNDTNLIRQQLIKAGLPNDLQIQHFNTGFQRSNPNIKHNVFFKLIVKVDMDEKLLKNVNSLFGVSVLFEKLKPNAVVQCHNCQSYFHTASMCYRK